MLHVDEAHDRAESILKRFLSDKPSSWRILLIKDLFARLRVILWCPKSRWEAASVEIDQVLQDEAPNYWTREVLRGSGKNEPPDGEWQAEAWQQGTPIGDTGGVRVMERQRTKEGWFEAPAAPPWTAARGRPTITSFYSFKGGVGRSTALAATALHLAAAGERVVVLDADLDAPGVGFLLSAHDGATASWGVVDYLIEQPLLGGNDELDLSDYFHRCPPSLFSGTGEIMVFPAGTTDGRYVAKLARLDYATLHGGETHPFVRLLEQIRQELAPDWILIDARAGLANVSGFVMGGLCHVHVVVGTLAEASWRGLAMILERLGADQVRAQRPQAECVLVAAMVPRSQERQYQESVAWFTDRAQDVFSDRYYAAPDQGDQFWTVDDVESSDAPHVPVPLSYDERLVLFRELDEVAKDVLLDGEPYRRLAERVRTSQARAR
ncbi:MAG: P-loop NTPase [Spirochaetaceae bacterium]|nr:P-loop NTPase [Spirochaetaceae bacterium]